MENEAINEWLESLSLDTPSLYKYIGKYFNFNKFRNRILWNRDSSLGIVLAPKGNIWNTIGIVNSSKAYVSAEEALYLAEYHRFDLFDGINLTTFEDFMLFCLHYCDHDAYKVLEYMHILFIFQIYKCLKRQGFILMRPECKYFLKDRMFSILRGEYSLFKPFSAFKKSNPSGYIGHVLEIK
jgi:hypothetical protein